MRNSHVVVHPDKYFDFTLPTIARVLSNLRRFNGHGEYPYLSVAHHSLHCLDLAIDFFPGDRRIQQLALFHDVAESFTGDIPQYIKRNLGQEAATYLNRIDRMFFQRLGIDYYGGTEKHTIKDIDTLALVLEAEFTFKFFDPDDWPSTDLKPSPNYDDSVFQIDYQEAEFELLEKMKEYQKL